MQRCVTSRRSAVFGWFLCAGLGSSALVGCARSEQKVGGTTRTASVGSPRAAPSASGPEASAVLLCTALHELPTRRRAECCAESPVTLYYAECVRLLSSAVRAGRIRIDRDQVATCAASVDAATRGCDWVAPTLGAAPAPCDAAVIGLVTAAGRCTSSLECARELHCAGQGATTPGVCRPPEPPGAACGTPVDSLATYLGVRRLEARKPACTGFCALTEHRCQEKPPEGAVCRVSAQCAADQRCASGRCVPRETGPQQPADVAVTCVTDLDCPSGGCVSSDDGTRRCGKKCSRELAALRPGAADPRVRALALPTKSGRPAP